jgi:amino acid transporter
MATHEASAPLQSTMTGTRLKAAAIGLPGATMQAVATIAPAIAGLFFTQYVVSLTGVTAPFAYVLGVCIVLMLGSTLVQLSKHMSSAGGYYTFVSRAINPRVGFMTAWMYVFYNPLCAGPIYAYFGYLLDQELKTHYGINAPYLWWLTLIVGAPFVAFLAWRGLSLSVRVLVGLGLAEMAIVFALALSGFISPGPGGDNLGASWVPSHSLSAEGFALAVVFSLQGLTGWEAAAPLAEETSHPRRNIPRATMIAIIALGIFLVFVYWGQIIGWGTSVLTGSSPKALVNSPDLPGLEIAHRLWGSAWVFVLAAMFSSTLAVCQACNNVSTRIWFKMGETGTLPKWFGAVHPKYRTPKNAVLANLVLSLAIGLGIGFLLNAQRSYLLTNGLILVLAVLYIYVSANVAVAFFYLKQKREEFNWVLHIVFPVVSTAALVYVTIKSFQPFPSFPYNWAPVIDGGWLVIGLVILVVLWRTGRTDWLLKAGSATIDADSIPEVDDTVAGGKVVD